MTDILFFDGSRGNSVFYGHIISGFFRKANPFFCVLGVQEAEFLDGVSAIRASVGGETLIFLENTNGREGAFSFFQYVVGFVIKNLL